MSRTRAGRLDSPQSSSSCCCGNCRLAAPASAVAEDDLTRRRRALIASLNAATCDSAEGESALEMARRRLRRVVKATGTQTVQNDFAAGADSAETRDPQDDDMVVDFKAVIQRARLGLRPADSRPPRRTREPADVPDPEDEAALWGLPDFTDLLQRRLRELRPAQETPAWIVERQAAAGMTKELQEEGGTDSQAASDICDSAVEVEKKMAASPTTATTTATTEDIDDNVEADDAAEGREIDAASVGPPSLATLPAEEVGSISQDSAEREQQQQQQQQPQQQQQQQRQLTKAADLDHRASSSGIEERCLRLLKGLEGLLNPGEANGQLGRSLLLTGLRIHCVEGGLGAGGEAAGVAAAAASAGVTAKLCQILLTESAVMSPDTLGLGLFDSGHVTLASTLPQLSGSWHRQDCPRHGQGRRYHPAATAAVTSRARELPDAAERPLSPSAARRLRTSRRPRRRQQQQQLQEQQQQRQQQQQQQPAKADANEPSLADH